MSRGKLGIPVRIDNIEDKEKTVDDVSGEVVDPCPSERCEIHMMMDQVRLSTPARPMMDRARLSTSARPRVMWQIRDNCIMKSMTSSCIGSRPQFGSPS